MFDNIPKVNIYSILPIKLYALLIINENSTKLNEYFFTSDFRFNFIEDVNDIILFKPKLVLVINDYEENISCIKNKNSIYHIDFMKYKKVNQWIVNI